MRGFVLSETAAVSGLLGLLVGDALGVPYEFHPPQALPAAAAIDMQPPPGFRRAHHGVPPATWSDDGAQALALLDALLAGPGLDQARLAANLRAWLHEGRFAVGGMVFDVGGQTATAINRLVAGTPPDVAGPSEERNNGNGSLMRAFPIAMMAWPSSRALVDAAMAQSRVTHGHPRSQLCCAMFCLWVAEIAGAADGAWERAAATLRAVAPGDPAFARETAYVLDVDRRVEASGTGHVVDTLWSARVAVESTTGYADCVRRAIAFGHDTDTTAAVAGAAAGVLYGYEGIPAPWRQQLRGDSVLQPLLARYRQLRAAANAPADTENSRQ